MSRSLHERETALDGLRIFQHPEWPDRYPGLRQGVTARGSDLDFGEQQAASSAWERLRRAAGVPRLVRCRQVHGSSVARTTEVGEDGLRFLGDADALLTDHLGTLLAITVADCVPVFLIDPTSRILTLAHAGWRGMARGVLEAALAEMTALGARADRIEAHLGPSICRSCYEVGPEVPRALGLSGAPAKVDLRAVAAARLVAAGLVRSQITRSGLCTRCSQGALYSYRGGDASRRACAFLGWIGC